MSEKFTKTRILVECAIMIALGTILAQIKLFEMPYGGSVDLASMLPFIIITYRHGTKWGLATGFANGLLQLALGNAYAPPAGTVSAFILMVLLDYILAFMSTGLAGIFAAPFKRLWSRVVSGVTGVFIIRFLMAFISGIVLWGSYAAPGQTVYMYSLLYNGGYCLGEFVVTLIVALALVKIYPNVYKGSKER